MDYTHHQHRASLGLLHRVNPWPRHFLRWLLLRSIRWSSARSYFSWVAGDAWPAENDPCPCGDWGASARDCGSYHVQNTPLGAARGAQSRSGSPSVVPTLTNLTGGPRVPVGACCGVLRKPRREHAAPNAV